MYTLNTGDKRYAAEITNGWKMYIRPILSSMTEVPDEVRERIRALEEAYQTEFLDFFVKEKNRDETLMAGRIHNTFDQEWEKKHPEFYDVDLLFQGCSEKDLAAAKEPLKEAKEAFTEE